MSIERTFDCESKEILTPENIFSKRKNFPKVAMGTFSQENIDIILDGRDYETVAVLDFGPDGTKVYKVSDNETEDFILFYCHLGGSAAVAELEEIIAMGGENFIFFGSCGCLERNIEAGSIVIPTAAYRDEGTSYHYMPPSDFIELENWRKCVSAVNSLGIKPLITKVWTTDALYRETRNNVENRKALGCKVVDMECASLAAAAKFRNVQFTQFLYTEDNLDGEAWDPGLQGKFTHDHRQQYVKIALEIAKL